MWMCPKCGRNFRPAMLDKFFDLAIKPIHGNGVPEDNEIALKLLTQAGSYGSNLQPGQLLSLWLRHCC